ncbi:sensor histidine kinase [Cohnella zeiphila]|uniref:histidine kinase n=1 Tax=Cohnella zeiphila TaxID=2761120 RepID=A0A7X0VXY5_9BACL|nr:HAMP domain-containing sensor histidine kinase [Cohnella zeiphila]MBB6733942.1 HAMP domain-containing histidine kinase [Cohnella zeiphila]
MWRNSGTRRLALLLAVAALVSIAAAWAFAAYETNRLKRDWTDRDNALIGELASRHPELSAELPGLFASKEIAADPKAREAGRKLAAEYGLEDIDVSLLPIVGSDRHRLRISLTVGLLFLFASLTVLLIREFDRPNRQIRRLTDALESVVKQNRPMDYRIYGEDDLGQLAHRVQELALRLQETISQLHRDKDFLKETIADISHQLKTPLASLMVYNELLKDERTAPVDAGEFLDICGRELERMEWLILTLLKIARLEAGALDLQRVRAPLGATIERAVEPLRKLASQKEVDIRVIEPEKPAEAVHDPRWLAEAIGNLVKNAVEHSPPGSAVTIRTERTPVFIRIFVRDEGQGVDERHLPHIFKKFYRAQSGSGVGLGLPLAKSVAERHEGILSAVRNEGAGMTFVLALPAGRDGQGDGSLTTL